MKLPMIVLLKDITAPITPLLKGQRAMSPLCPRSPRRPWLRHLCGD